MKVLLCSQYYGKTTVFPAGICFPLGLAYVASSIRDHDVTILDTNVVNDPLEELSRQLVSLKPEVVGVSLRNIDLLSNARLGQRVSLYSDFKYMIRLIKEKSPASKLVVGGPGFSIFSREIMAENTEIDFGVVSDFENTISNLLRNIEHPRRVKNLLLRCEKGVEFTGEARTADFDLLPSPRRDLFDLSEYKKTPYSLNVQSKRGCSFRCAYCTDPFLGGYSLQMRSVKKVVDEVEELVDIYGVKSFWFVDSIFNYPPEHAMEICREMRKRKLKVDWRAYFREDFFSLQLAQEAVAAGCRGFEFHTDGACDRVLDLLGKDIRRADIEATFDVASQIENAKVGYNLFYDLPRDNIRNLVALARFTAKATLRCKRKLEYVAMTRMRIYPHTLLHEVALSEGKISPDTNLLYPVFYQSRFPVIQDRFTSLLENLSSLFVRIFG